MKSIVKKLIILTIFLIILGLAIWAFYIEPGSFLVNQYPLKLQKWSAKQNGLK